MDAQEIMSSALLTVDKVGRRFGGLQALSNVSFSVAPGSATGIIGPNGSGKSTLFEIIAGAQQPTTGRVYYGGRDVTPLMAHDRCELGIARTFQMVETLAQMSVFENVVVAAMLRKRGKAARLKVQELLERLGLEGRAHRPARELSASELRRLDVARALATEPKLLLLDEPLAGLTDNEIDKSFDVLRELRDGGLTIIMIEHRLEAMFGFVSQVIALDTGTVIASGPPNEVRKDDRVVASYIGRGLDADT
jgi:branched-chain amino acid transport system ATP-binding protein